MSPNEEFGLSDPVVDNQLDFGQNDPVVGKPTSIAVNQLDFGKDDPVVGQPTSIAANQLDFGKDDPVVNNEAPAKYIPSYGMSPQGATIGMVKAEPEKPEQQFASNYWEELGKYAGKSMTEVPGSMVKAAGGALDMSERLLRNNSLLGVEPGEVNLGAGMAQALNRPEVTGSTLGNIVQDVGQEMVERPKLFGVDVGYTKELGLLPDPLRANQTTMQAAGSIGSMAATMLTPGGVVAKTLMGGALQSQGQADQAKQYILEHGGTEEQANSEAAFQFVANLPAGAVESLPWGNFINRFGGKDLLNAASKKFGATAIKRIASAIGEQAFLEGGEEGVQQLIGNLTAFHYNPNQDINEGIWQSIKVGALMGAGMAAPAAITAEVANKLSKDYEAKTEDQKLVNVKQTIAETKKNDPENDVLLNDLADLAHRLENKIADKSSVAEFNATVQKADKERADAIAAEKSAANLKTANEALARFRQGANGLPDPTDRPERQLEIINLVDGKDVSTLTIEGQIFVKEYTAALKDEIARKKAMSTAASDQEKARQAQIAESQKAATETDKAINKVVATANPTPTAVDMGVTATDAIKSNPATAAATLNSLTNTTLGTPAVAPEAPAAQAAAGAEAPAAAPVREGGVFADIINPPVNDQELAGIAEEVKGKAPEEAIKFLQTKLTDLDKRLTPEQKAMGVSMIDQLKKTPAPVKTTEFEIETNNPSYALSQWQKYVSSVEKESNELMSEWASLVRKRGPYEEFLNQEWADKLGITLKSLNEYYATFSQAGPGTLKYRDTISQFETDRINQKKKPAIVTHAEDLKRLQYLNKLLLTPRDAGDPALPGINNEKAKYSKLIDDFRKNNPNVNGATVAPEKAPLSEQEFGMIANELQGKTPDEQVEIIENVMDAAWDRLTKEQKTYANKALKGLNDTIAQSKASQKLAEPLSKTVLPLLSPTAAVGLTPEVAAKAARYNFEENEPGGGVKHPQWKVKNKEWEYLVNRRPEDRVAPEKALLSNQELGVIANEIQGKTPDESRDILESAMSAAWERLQREQSAKPQVSPKLAEPLSKAVLPLLSPTAATGLTPEVAAKAARYNFEENEPGGGRVHPQWSTYNKQWDYLVNKRPEDRVSPASTQNVPDASLGDQAVTIERFDSNGNYVQENTTAAEAKKWADKKFEALNELLDCIKS